MHLRFGTFLFRAVVYEVRRAVFRAAGVLRFIRIRRCLLLERHTERARGNSDGFSYTTDAVVIRSLSAGKRRECGTFYFRERQRPPSATHERWGCHCAERALFFRCGRRTFSLGRERILRALSRTEGRLGFEEAAACISFLHKVERIENESFGEYFRIPRLHGGEECAGRLFRCDGCEVYAADRFGEVDPFDAVVSPKEGIGQRYVVNDALQFGDGYGRFPVGLARFSAR